MGRACSVHGRKEKCDQGFGGKPEGKTLLGRPRRRWEDKLILDLDKHDGMVLFGFIRIEGQWRALVMTVMNLRVSSGVAERLLASQAGLSFMELILLFLVYYFLLSLFQSSFLFLLPSYLS
jgi:hypothetical protein